jgi:hypothetical protein
VDLKEKNYYHDHAKLKEKNYYHDHVELKEKDFKTKNFKINNNWILTVRGSEENRLLY